MTIMTDGEIVEALDTDASGFDAARLPECDASDPLDVAAHAVSAILERDRWWKRARALELQLEAVREVLR